MYRKTDRLLDTALLTSMFNKDTPKHETRVPCVGRASARHGRLKSALRHAILVGCGRCLTLITRPLIRFFVPTNRAQRCGQLAEQVLKAAPVMG